MSGPEQFNAAAVAAPNPLDSFAVGYGLNFMNTDILEKTTFKCVVGSWRRLNYGTTATNDFEVDVSDYAPKQCFVNRVQLVDVDIPNTQLLIEDIWNRVYFNLGCRVTIDCRTFNFSYKDTCSGEVDTKSAVLPLPLDDVRQYQLLNPGFIRLYMKHRAPRPIVPLAHAWQSLKKIGYGSMQLMGVPGLGAVEIEYNAVADESNMSLVIQNNAVYAALQNSFGDPPKLCLVTSTLPGPSFLAKIVSRCISYDLNTNLISPTCNGHDVVTWLFNIVYSESGDTFNLHVRAPFPAQFTVDGPISDYMGFGSPYMLESSEYFKIATSGPKPRFQQGDSFAAIQAGDPSCDTQLATWVTDAFSAFVWKAFTFQVAFPGGTVYTIVTSAGNMSLADLAVDIQLALDTVILPAGTVAVTVQTCPYPGLVFTSELFSFSLDFTVDADFHPPRIGYDFKKYPAAYQHLPTRPSRHIPLLPGVCGTTCCSAVQYTVPQSIISVYFRPEINQLVFESQPYSPFGAILTQNFLVPYEYFLASSPYNANLFVGCEVLLAFTISGVYYQVKAIVVNTTSQSQFTIILVDPNDASVLPDISAGADITVIPETAQPLVLFMQRALTDAATLACTQGYVFPRKHGRTIDPEIIGFDAMTYESCGKLLTSPGTLEKWQDSYILVCLAFAAGGAPPVTGDVYYPMSTNNTIVFAKVLRGSVFLRADFDRMFDHIFAGSGIHLGYVRVRIMNPNGTPYQTHGHSCSITLKFDARSSAVAFGGAHTVVPGNSPVNMMPLARGTLISRNYPEYVDAVEED